MYNFPFIIVLLSDFDNQDNVRPIVYVGILFYFPHLRSLCKTRIPWAVMEVISIFFVGRFNSRLNHFVT